MGPTRNFPTRWRRRIHERRVARSANVVHRPIVECEAKPLVLVVDDTPANLVATRAVLSSLDVEIIDASSGREALACVEEHTFAVALVDVQMPKMDGFELARRLRHRPDCKELPIIFVTAIHRD